MARVPGAGRRLTFKGRDSQSKEEQEGSRGLCLFLVSTCYVA